MAIDARILTQGAFVPSVARSLNIFDQALESAEQRKIREQQAPLIQQQLEQQVKTQQRALDEQSENRIIRSVAEFAPVLRPALEGAIESGDTAEAQTLLTQRLIDLQNRGLDTTETVEAITQLRQGNTQQVLAELNAIDAAAEQRGLVRGTPQQSAGQREFTDLITMAGGDKEDLTTRAARIKLGLDPRAVGSAEQTLAQDEDAQGKVITFKERVINATKLAEKQATELGAELTDLNRMESTLPELKNTVNELKKLAPLATSTLAGRGFDTLSKELGFGSTKGANARARFISIIDNQVLPLLKPTFGGSFTVEEGKALKASLADPDASPEQKIEQLNAFLEQKERDIRSKRATVGGLGGNNSGFKIISIGDQ